MKVLRPWNYKGQVHHKWCGGNEPCMLSPFHKCEQCPLYAKRMAAAVPQKAEQLFLMPSAPVSSVETPKSKQAYAKPQKDVQKPPCEPELDYSNPLDLPIEDYAQNPEPLAPIGEPQFSVWDEPPAEDAIETACAYCGKYFIAPKNKLYCSMSCKKKAYRRRWLERGKQKIVYQQRICTICGKPFIPRTDEQKTCGGECNVQYMRQVYGYGVRKNHPAEVQKPLPRDEMETDRNAPIEHRKEFVQQATRHLPQGRAMFGLHDCEAAAARIDRRLFWWRTIAMPRQAVLLEIALLYGDAALFSMGKFLSLVRSGKWQAARNTLMLCPYANAGRALVENARQIASGAWEEPIPAYIPDEDNDEESESYEDPEGYELGENGTVWERW